CPQLHRFLNQDILLGNTYDPLSLNRFAYCNGDPVNGIDPLGLVCMDSGDVNWLSNQYNMSSWLSGLFNISLDCYAIGAQETYNETYKAIQELEWKDVSPYVHGTIQGVDLVVPKKSWQGRLASVGLNLIDAGIYWLEGDKQSAIEGSFTSQKTSLYDLFPKQNTTPALPALPPKANLPLLPSGPILPALPPGPDLPLLPSGSDLLKVDSSAF
ncbi:MAG: hypothetical protein K1X66_09565, partial [Verrucomicrobiae bacterium]|nr:hypothetical protein [Verrucomicrobiae bacterium]